MKAILKLIPSAIAGIILVALLWWLFEEMEDAAHFRYRKAIAEELAPELSKTVQLSGDRAARVGVPIELTFADLPAEDADEILGDLASLGFLITMTPDGSLVPVFGLNTPDGFKVVAMFWADERLRLLADGQVVTVEQFTNANAIDPESSEAARYLRHVRETASRAQ
ncbi:MAG: hypothetical protein ACQKBV_11260 [Puniceicoccales bacterium]